MKTMKQTRICLSSCVSSSIATLLGRRFSHRRGEISDYVDARPNQFFQLAVLYPIDELSFINHCAVLKGGFHKLSVLDLMTNIQIIHQCINTSMYILMSTCAKHPLLHGATENVSKKPYFAPRY